MFTEFDVLVSVIITAFTLVAFARGFVKDVLSFIAWFGSSIITLYFYPFAASFVDNFFKNPVLVSVISVMVIYLISIIAFASVNVIILKSMGEHRKGIIDRSLGIVFGLFKGLFLVSLIHYCVVLVAEKEPDWLTEGETYKITNYGYKFLEENTGDYIADLVKKTKEKMDEAQETQENLNELMEEGFEIIEQ